MLRKDRNNHQTGYKSFIRKSPNITFQQYCNHLDKYKDNRRFTSRSPINLKSILQSISHKNTIDFHKFESNKLREHCSSFAVRSLSRIKFRKKVHKEDPHEAFKNRAQRLNQLSNIKVNSKLLPV